MGRKGPAEFKGTFNGLYINVDSNASFEEIILFLEKLLKDKADFYRGSKIIGLTGKPFNYREKAMVEALIEAQSGIEVISLEESVSEVKKVPETLKVEIEKESVVEKPVVAQAGADTHFVYGTMRSGKSVHFAGHVVVVGDVNPGAEIIAEGNIVVMGRILGFVHAGSSGDESAVVVANLLKPTQIRIAKYISVPPNDDHSEHTVYPERAFISEGLIKIEKCH